MNHRDLLIKAHREIDLTRGRLIDVERCLREAIKVVNKDLEALTDMQMEIEEAFSAEKSEVEGAAV